MVKGIYWGALIAGGECPAPLPRDLLSREASRQTCKGLLFLTFLSLVTQIFDARPNGQRVGSGPALADAYHVLTPRRMLYVQGPELPGCM